MSGFKSSEDDLMKNLSANERRKLMRHIENAQQGGQRKSSSHQSYNVTPKPFNNAGSNHQAKFQSNNPPKPSSVKSSSAYVKPVQAPNGKSSDVDVPKLNQDFVNMFNSQSGSSSKARLKPVPNKPSTVTESSSAKNKPFNFRHPPASNQSSVSSRASSNAASSTPNFAKVSPVPSAAAHKPSPAAHKPSTAGHKPSLAGNRPSSAVHNHPSASVPSNPRPSSSSVVTPAWKKALNERKSADNIAINPSKRPVSSSAPKPSISSQSVGSKPPPSSVSQAKTVLEGKKPAVTEVKSKPKDSAAQRDPPKPTPSASKPSQEMKPSPKKSTNFQSVVAKPTSNVLPQRAEPLTQDKNTGKSAPPTAVVSPIQDKSKSPITEVKKSAEAARQRSVSTPVPPPSNVVAYSATAENMNLPDLSIAERNSVLANETKMKRSFSDASKVAAQMKDTAPKNKKLGHNFQPHELKDWVNWCDACGNIILSLFGKCVSCTKCKMVCHGKCALAVSLTCEADQQIRSQTLTDGALSFYKTIVQETKDESTLKEYNTIQRVITIEEVQQRIEEFNKTVKGSQQMTLQENGETFRGFIRVTMNLTRPVSVVDNASKTVKKPVQRKASFYIDKGAMKALHLTSDTTAEQVVQALLHKYNITDNPMKFALFEKQVREEGHVILRKMLPRERPLFLRLLWGNGSSDARGFTLQENESRDIHWESFSIAELQMFIKILDKEENDYIIEIKRKYKNKATDIKNAIEHQNKLAAMT